MRDIFSLAFSAPRMSAGGDTAEILLYGQIINDIREEWKWGKQDKGAAEFDRALKDARKAGAKKLLLRINSPGGICTQAVAMRSALANAGFEEIQIRIEGLCASAATDIATIPDAHVQIAEGSEYMIHNPWLFTWGNANDLEHDIERLRNIEQVSRGFYMKRTGQAEEQIRQWMDEEKWFTAAEAVEYGFADELMEAGKGMPAAACVTSREMATMRGLYKAVPERIVETAAHEEETRPRDAPKDDSNAAGAAAEIQTGHEEEDEETMDIKDITIEQLRAENTALHDQIMQAGAQQERERIQDIDDLTPAGEDYAVMAANAKKNGTSAIDFHKQIVKAGREKAQSFLSARKDETAPAAGIKGGDAADMDGKDARQELDENAREMAELAKQLYPERTGGMH
jgi:ATP-dependent Clp protease protease subunit